MEPIIPKTPSAIIGPKCQAQRMSNRCEALYDQSRL
jgi:hypothetical protein